MRAIFKSGRLAVPASLLLVVLACASAGGPAMAGRSDAGADLTAVIDGVREAILEAETRDVPGFPPLKSVDVKLQTTVSRSASGEVRYLVASLSSGVSADATSTLELNLKPPEIQRERTLSKETLKSALANAIHLAKVGVSRAGEGAAPMATKSVSIDLRFAVELDAAAGGGVKLVPVGLEGTAKISREKVHAVGLTFAN
jgi:NTP-dependent ternary system trypsin peptidase co-occuring protein